MSLQHLKGFIIALQLSAVEDLACNTAARDPATVQRLDLGFGCGIDHEENLEANANVNVFAVRHDVIGHLSQGKGSARSCGGSQKGRQGLTSHRRSRHPLIPDAFFASQAADLHQQRASLSLPDVLKH